MAIRIGNYDFAGPLMNLESVPNSSGVYAVLALNYFRPGTHGIVDIGESSDMRQRLSFHDR